MKLLVIGLDCAAPEILLRDERLFNIRRLMEGGCYGRLESVVPPITVPAWMCMATSQDPGSLGVYGFRNRTDRSYGPLRVVDSRSIRELTVWDQLAREGRRSVLIGVPPSFPPRPIHGVRVGCFLTPDPGKDTFTHPPEAGETIRRLVGDYPVDVQGFRTEDKEWLRDRIQEMTRKHFEVVRHFLRHEEWDYFQFVEIGLDRMQHGFWRFHDPSHPRHEPDGPFRDVISTYYRTLDHELGEVLALLEEDTAVLVLSDHGARPLEGGFCINEWLIREGLLVLEERPEVPTPLEELAVDWDRTAAWGAGGYYARVFLNVKGREPRGTVEPGDYERVRKELATRLEATMDPAGRPLGTRAFVPEEIYAAVRNVPPDLIVHLGDLAWRSIGSVGHGRVHLPGNDTGPDDCNHALFGAFVLAAPNNPLRGEVEGARLLDMAPTLLELGGYEVPSTMQGRSLVAGAGPPPQGGPGSQGGPTGPGLDPAAEEAIRERLSGLGYIS